MLKKLLLSLIIMLSLTGCTSNKEINNKSDDKLAIKDVNDYYINYFNDLVKEDYKLSYAAYKYTNQYGSKEDFKANYKRKDQTYAFYDLNGDGTDEFALLTQHEKDENITRDYTWLDIYTIDLKTKEISKYFSAICNNNLFYNADLNVYLTKYVSETGSESYDVFAKDEKDKVYGVIATVYYNSNTKKYYKIGDNDGKILTRYDIENSTISEEEYLKYISNLKEIKFNFKDIEDIYDNSLDDELLEEIEVEMKGYTDNKDLKCTNKDVDNIVNLLLSGKSVRISQYSDIKFSSREVMQYYNSSSPLATIYTISCGRYSRSVRISK